MNDGPSTAPLEAPRSAGIKIADNTTLGFYAVAGEGNAPAELVSVNAAGNLTAWHNLVHAQFIGGTDPLPANYDRAVYVPGAGGGTIRGTVWNDVAASGQWSANDPAWGENNVQVYLDMNNNGALDAGEPSTDLSADGTYEFSQLLPREYHVRLLVGSVAGGRTASQTYPASHGGIAVVVPNAPAPAVYGNDFGIHVSPVSSDLNGDGSPDLLLTDPSTNDVYVQSRIGVQRLATDKLGRLPGPGWAVAGTGDFTGDGRPDVLLAGPDGELRVWEVSAAGGRPVVVRTTELAYAVPAGFEVAAFADVDGDNDADLILADRATGKHLAVLLAIDGPAGALATSAHDLVVPADHLVVGAGDLDGDGRADLLLRDGADGHLVASLHRDGGADESVDLGKPDSEWAVAGVLNLTGASDSDGVLFQDRVTGQGHYWQLGTGAAIESTLDIDIGAHDGLRLHLAEGGPIVATGTVAGRVFRDLTGDGPTADDVPQADVKVRLFSDRNGNRIVDAADGAAVASVLTGSDGRYAFADLEPGQYLVREAVPAGYVRVGEPLSGAYPAAVTDESPAVDGLDFYNFKRGSAVVTDVQFHVTHDGVTRTVKSLAGNVRPGDAVRADFTVPVGKSATVSLVSYEAKSLRFNRATLVEQTVHQSASDTFGPGRHSLAVEVADSYFQDFVTGGVIPTFGPAGSNLSYGEQHRLISSGRGG